VLFLESGWNGRVWGEECAWAFKNCDGYTDARWFTKRNQVDYLDGAPAYLVQMSPTGRELKDRATSIKISERTLKRSM